MPKNSPNNSDSPRLRTVLKNDILSGDLSHTVRRDLRDLREFYIDDSRKELLKKMSPLKRWLYTLGWLLKALFLKLTPARRILLCIGLFVALFSSKIQFGDSTATLTIDPSIIAFILILVVLMLELKDKLLARSELTAGRAVQIALMPERSPSVPGWDVWLMTRPANEVGGDLLDYIKVDQNRAGLALGDVAGKGLGAALFMVKLQSTLRAFIPNAGGIADLGRKVNEIFYRDKVPNIFASLVYVELVSDSSAVRLLNAGHLLPIFLSNDGLREIPKSGPGLGILPEPNFQEQCIEMSGNDLMVIYSDGVTEARNENGDFFGTERLSNLLLGLRNVSSKLAGETILSNVDLFIGRAPIHDDLSLIVIQRIHA